MDCFSVVIPIFNEDKNIEFLFEEIIDNLKEYSSFQIVVVNDCSTDHTISVLNNYSNSKHFTILHNKKNMGQSYSIKHGINNSLYENIITIDGDGQNDPSDFSKLIKLYCSDNKIKMVAGIRTNRKDSYLKIISSKIANYIRNIVLKDGCQDTGCSLKIFEKKIFQKLPFFDGIHRFLPALFIGYNYKVYYVNVNHRKRKFGNTNYGTFDRLLRGIRDMNKVKKIIKNINA